ncbi:Secologanin synthase [Bertholletia excelsa]
MEVGLSSSVVTTFAVTAIVIWWCWRVLNWLWLRPKKLGRCFRELGLGGNSYRHLHGDTDEHKMMMEATSRPIILSNDIRLHAIPIYDHLVEKFCKNSFTWVGLGPEPRLNIMEPELIKEVLLKMDTFKKPIPNNPPASLLISGVPFYDGKKWEKHRKIINPAFHMEKFKLMVPAICLSCCEMISKWEALVLPKGLCEVDVWPYLANLAADVISRTAFGSNYEQGKRIFSLQREQIDIIVKLIRSFYIPGWRFLPTKINRRIKKIYREVGDLLNVVINKRKEAVSEHRTDDLLGILLKSNLKEMQQQGNRETVTLTIEEVTEECKLFYIAGQETTSVFLVWTMILLSKYPKWQDLAREEVLAVLGDKKPYFDGLNELKVVTMILYEVLRLYLPASLILRRVAKVTKLREFVLPAGVIVFVPITALHYDPEIWGKDALEFNPATFAEGISKAARVEGAFLPFGGGPRICIRQNFALMEAKIAMAVILPRFSFQLSPSYLHCPALGLTMQPKHGAALILQKL